MKLKDSPIVIFALLIAIILGIFVGVKFPEEKNDSKPIEDNNEEFTLKDVENLMSKYKLNTCDITYYITDLKDANSLAIQKVSTNNTVKCDDIKDAFDNVDKYLGNGSSKVLYNQCIENEQSNGFKHYAYNYENVLNAKKELFGSEAILNKNTFDINTVIAYVYSGSKDVFVSLLMPSGCVPTKFELGIKSYKLIDDTVEIIAYNDTINKNYRNAGTYKYQFKQANNSYYLVDITKVD